MELLIKAGCPGVAADQTLILIMIAEEPKSQLRNKIYPMRGLQFKVSESDPGHNGFTQQTHR